MSARALRSPPWRRCLPPTEWSPTTVGDHAVGSQGQACFGEGTVSRLSLFVPYRKDRNGVFHAVGIDDGIDFNVNQTTGGVKTDMNGYTLVGTSTTGALSPKLDAATVTAFLAVVAVNP